MNTYKPGCPANALTKPDSNEQKSVSPALITPYANFSGAYSEIKQALLTQANLPHKNVPSQAESPHNQFNYGQRYDNPDFVRGVETTCRFILASGAIRDGFTLHKSFGPQYIEKLHGIKSLALNGGVSAVHIALSGASSVYGAITLADFLKNKNTQSENTFGAVFNLLWHTSDFLGDVSEELDRLTIVAKGWKHFSGLHNIKWLGKASFGLELFSTVGALQELRSLKDSQAPGGLKAAAISETTLGALSSLTKVAVDAMWIDKARQGLKITGKAPFIALGAAIIGSVLHPLQFYSIDKEFDYARRLDALAGEFTSQGYDGHKLLAELYRNKATFDAVATALQTVLSLTGGVVSLAMMASVVGAPLGIAVQLITATLAGIADLVSQPAIEAMAEKQRNTILAFEKNHGGENYFSHQLDIYYQADQAKIGEYTKAEQQNYKTNRVVSVHQMTSDAQARELAALTKLAEKSTSGKAYIDVFKQGVADKTKQVSLDSDSGIIELGDNGGRQLLMFTQPLLTPGKEDRQRSKEGKNKYMTILNMINQGQGWKVIDKGTTDTLADFSNVIQRIKMKEGTTKEIAIHADMGSGSDLVKASAGTMHISGGEGIDVVDYSELSGTKIQVTAQVDGGYKVIKKSSNSKLYTEETTRQQFNYGKRSETVEYRNVSLKTVSYSQATDQLDSIEEIVGSAGDDLMTGGTGRDVFYGHDGDDTLSGNGGDDVLRGGRGDDEVYGGSGDDLIVQNIADEEDFFCGGEGIDTLDYSETQFKAADKNAKGIDIDLAVMGVQGGETIKYLYDNNGKFIKTQKDTFKKIENVIATSLHDRLCGDNENNVFAGGSGNDHLEGKGGDDTLLGGEGNDRLYGGDGKDKLFGGSGKNVLDGGNDDDDLYIESIEGSTLDGGSGEDTLDASLINPGDKTGLLIHLAHKKIAINRPHAEDAPKDSIKNIENVIGTQWKDVIYGDEQDNKLSGGAEDDSIYGKEGNDLIFGDDGNDRLFGGLDQDVIYGGRGQDRVEGNGGNDELHQNFGPEGDFLDGGEGDDTVDYSLSFRYGDNASAQTANKNGIEVNLMIGHAKRTGMDSSAPQDRIRNIENIKGTHLKDALTGDKQNNLIFGGEGDDWIAGGDGDDILYGEQGDDTLSGGKGNDRLIGAEGSDTYRFSSGDGQDTVTEYSVAADDIDHLQFGENIDQQQLWLTKNGDDLVIRILGTEDQVTVSEHFKGNQYRLEKIHLHGNQTLSYEAIDKLVEEMAKIAAPASGETIIPPAYVSQFAYYWAVGS